MLGSPSIKITQPIGVRCGDASGEIYK